MPPNVIVLTLKKLRNISVWVCVILVCVCVNNFKTKLSRTFQTREEKEGEIFFLIYLRSFIIIIAICDYNI